MTDSLVIVIDIKGLETHNEKSARDKNVKRVRSKLSGKMIHLRSGYSKRVAEQRGLARIVVQSQTTLAQRQALALGCSARLIRIAPRLLHDVSESAPSALAAVRDGVADALGLDDRDASMGGLIAWSYGQQRGPYGVRVELRPLDVMPALDPLVVASRIGMSRIIAP